MNERSGALILFRTVGIALASSGIGISCTGPLLQELQIPAATILWDFPLDSAAPDIGVVLQARLASQGRKVLVLDAVSPHLRQVGADGSVQVALRGGEAPGEVIDPIALTVWDDTAFVASGDFQLKMVGLREWGVSTVPIQSRAVLGIGTGCSSDVVQYGPERLPDSAGAWSYLSVVGRSGDSVRHQHVLVDKGPDDQLVAVGRPSGIVGGGNTLLIRHDFGRPRILRARCSAGGVLQLEDWWELQSGMPRMGIQKPGGRPYLIGKNLLLPAGIARLGRDSVVIASLRLGRHAGEIQTRFEVFAEGGRSLVDVPGHWILRDWTPEGIILLERGGDTPRLFIIEANGLTHALLAQMR